MKVTIENISKKFGSKQIFDRASLEVLAGETCGVVGLNGIGKTTLFRMILGLTNPDSGTISIGHRMHTPNREFFRSVGAVLGSDGFNEHCTFSQNMHFFARLKGLDNKSATAYISEHWASLSERNTAVRTFSRGQRIMCSLARCFLGEPQLILLDEPQVNLDSDGLQILTKLITDAKNRGATLFLSSHQAETISDYCTTVATISQFSIHKRTSEDSLLTSWIIRGENLLSCSELVQKYAGNIYRSHYNELSIQNVSKYQIAECVKFLSNSNALVWEVRPTLATYEFGKKDANY